MALGQYIGAGTTVTELLCKLNGDATDTSGNSRNGTPVNAAWVGGKIGSGAYSGNGSNSYLNFGNVIDEDGSGAFTISFSVNFNSVAANQMIFGKQLSSGSFAGFMVWGQYLTSPARFRMFFSLVSNDGTFGAIDVATPVNELITGRWYDVKCTYDGSKSSSGAKIYIDGLLKSSSITNTLGTKSISNSANLNIGSRNNGNLPMNGLIDEALKEGVEWSLSKIRRDVTYKRGLFATI